MAKARIYEIAKQLNTTSKRLMEKLEEINIKVKNHMSLLKDADIDALYDHIGVVKRKEQEVSAKKHEEISTIKREKNKGPTIIRKREINLDIKEEKEIKKENKKSNLNVKNANSGLRQGFVYGDDSYEKLLQSIRKENKEKQNEVYSKVEEKKESEKKDVQNKSIQKEVVHNKDVRKDIEQKGTDKTNAIGNRKDNKTVFRTDMKEKNRNKKERVVQSVNMGNENNKKQVKNNKFKDNGRYARNNVERQSIMYNEDKGQKSSQSKELSEKQAEIVSKQERRETLIKETEKARKREQKKESLIGNRTQNLKESKNSKKYMNVSKEGVSGILSSDDIDEYYEEKGRKRVKNKVKQKDEINKVEIPSVSVKNVKVGEFVSVKELAEAMKKTSAEVIKKLMFMGMMVTLNSELDYETAVLVGDEFGITVERAVEVKEEDILFKDDNENDEAKMQPRPPVVVVMGHVDHGKTSLLDAIRKTNVTTGEAGGITQHIGAHTVKINNKSITFLDTPGHEAFTAMRARGAEVTDIVILVVAADDGVMPQTVEAINHAKAAKVSIIVAINKIDKEGANPERVKQELSEYGLIPEEWGGDTIFVSVSAKKNEGIENLLEMITLVSEMLELKANPERQARGTVIEAKLDKDRGSIATLLVQEGTLNVGDSIVAGVTFGRIRAMVDDKRRRIKKAGPSTPVEILGLHEVPEAGEIFHAITDEKLAKSLIEKRKLKQRQKQLKASAKVSLEELYEHIKSGDIKDLNLIVKADVQGSVEAVKQSLQKLTNDEVRINIIHGGVGAITEQDVILAQVSNAIIIGFNVRPVLNASEVAKSAGVDIRLYRVIYNAIEDIEAAMKGMLDPTFKEVVLGHVEIRQIFKVSGVGTIGGAYVLDGKITRNSEVRVIRDGIVINEGKLASLKRFKDDVKEVQQGFECGISIESFNDIKEGDIVEAFEMEEVKRV